MSISQDPLTPGIPASWPSIPTGLDAQKYGEKLLDAQLKAYTEDLAAEAKDSRDRVIAAEKADSDRIAAEEKAVSDQDIALDQAYRDADIANLGKYYDKIATLAVGSIERTRAAAELVQKASAAIAGLYTGVLALVFSVSDNPLPARGVLAPIFLGAAVVLSTAYSAYIREPGRVDDFFPGPRNSMFTRAYEQLEKIIETSSRIVNRRTYTLRMSVVALGVGLAAIALPFITFTTSVESSAPPTDWPSAAPTMGNDKLNEILFTAQVAEAAQERAAQGKVSVVDEWDKPILFIGLAVGIALVIFVPKWQGNNDVKSVAQTTGNGMTGAAQKTT